LLSLQQSTLKVGAVYIINNGGLPIYLEQTPFPVLIHTSAPMGVAESWNWFINNVPEERVITNDDIEFLPDSLEKLVASKADLVWGKGFSCFVIRDSCVRKIGLFDEAISPGYGYYEDEDYLQRLDGRGTRERSASAENVDAGLRHEHSATLKAASHAEILEHHRRFKIAQENYAKKWGVVF
jgi:hypothetical protein